MKYDALRPGRRGPEARRRRGAGPVPQPRRAAEGRRRQRRAGRGLRGDDPCRAVRTTAGPVKIGVTAVLDPEPSKRLADPTRRPAPTVKPPDEVLPGVLGRPGEGHAGPGPDGPGAARAGQTLAAKFPGFDVVVATSPSPTPTDGRRAAQRRQDAAGQRRPEGEVRRRRRPLPRTRSRSSATSASTARPAAYDGEAEPMRKLIEDEFQETAQAAGVVENFPRHDLRRRPRRGHLRRRRDVQDVPPQHLRQVGRHQARPAPTTLARATRSGTAIHDAECISCHTTGFEYTSGWVSAELTPYLKGNQCENCHGPARSTSPSPTTPTYRKAMALTAERPTRTASASAATTRTTRPTSTSPTLLRPDRPQGARHVRRPQGPPGPARRRWPRRTADEPAESTLAARSVRRRKRIPPMTEPRPSLAFEARPVRGEVPRGPHAPGQPRPPRRRRLADGRAWRSILLPFRPLWSLGLFLGGYALMFVGHFLFERNTPTDPQAPEHALRDRLGRDPRPLRRPGPPGDPVPRPGKLAGSTGRTRSPDPWSPSRSHGHRSPAGHRPGRPRPSG